MLATQELNTLFTELPQSVAWLDAIRKDALKHFTGFPNTKSETWRYTNLSPLTKIDFSLAQPVKISKDKLEILSPNHLVFVNGHFQKDLSALDKLPEGVIILSLKEALKNHSNILQKYFTKIADYKEQSIIALNTAFTQDGSFIYLPKNVVLEDPIQLIYLSSAPNGPTASFPRNLIVAETSTEAKIIECYIGLDENVYFTNAVTEVHLKANAKLHLYKIERESPHAFHIESCYNELKQNSHFFSYVFDAGGAIVRNDLNVRLQEKGSECNLYGLYILNGNHHVDNMTLVNHEKPHTRSSELYKGILDGESRGIFNGKIKVYPDAQKTDSSQSNKTLLLSKKALAHTRPQLEILADDVKCSHGSTVGQLDQNFIFYMRSRGLAEEEARTLLTFAFANEIISEIKIKSLQNYIQNMFLPKLHMHQKVIEAAL